MTGPEHYRKAERLLNAADSREQRGDWPTADRIYRRAQVHATLALAAATALDAVKDYACGRPEVQQCEGIRSPKAGGR